MLLLLACLLSPAETPLRDTIDAELSAAWKREKLTPSGPSTDGEFLRRVTLDLVGTVPSLDEVTAFLADTSADKRAKAIDRLMADPRFAKHQTDVWEQALLIRDPNSEAWRGRDRFKTWFADKIAKDEPYTAIVRAMLLAEQEGSELFLVQYSRRPEDTTEAVSRLFLGTQLQCARCHDHPFDGTLTQRDFYGLAGFFVRLVVVESGSGKGRTFKVGEKSTGEVLFTGAAKDARPGLKGEPVKPKFLGGPALDEPPLAKGFKEADLKGNKMPPKPTFSRKEKLATWVTAADNPYFARAAVNRVWGQFMGRGVVHPVDDLGGKNQPTLPGLLDEMTKRFAEKKYSLRWLIREVVSSKAYQLSGKGDSTDALPRFYERARVRPLAVEELFLSFRTATLFDASGGKVTGAIREYMQQYFGKPTNGQGEFQGGLMEHLFLNNSGELKQMISRRKGNLADRMMSAPAGQRAELLFLAVLSRKPTEAERERFTAYLNADAKSNARVEEAIWVLLNSAAFRFNH
jgi:hypothetical protein